MPESERANASQRTRTSAAILIAALVVFSAIAIVQSNLLEWPLASELQSLEGHLNGSQTNSTSKNSPDSSILVSAIADLPSSSSGPSQNLTTEILPIGGALVKLFSNASVSGSSPGSLQGRLNIRGVLIASSSTNAKGQIFFKVHSGRYLITLSSPVGNLSVFVLTAPKNTTEVDVRVNDTSYTASYYEVQESGTPGTLLPWENLFLRIDSKSLNSYNANESVYLKFVNSPSTANTTTTCTSSTGGVCSFNITTASIFPFQGMPVRVINEFGSSSQGTLWMQVQTNSIVNITGISGIDILVSFSAYTLKEYPMSNESLTNNFTTTSTG
jgi:hypothetical protein